MGSRPARAKLYSKTLSQKKKTQALVAHAYNLSYSGGRTITVQSQPGQIVQEIPSRKKPSKKGLVEWLKV
jgi:hypothetical protein